MMVIDDGELAERVRGVLDPIGECGLISIIYTGEGREHSRYTVVYVSGDGPGDRKLGEVIVSLTHDSGAEYGDSISGGPIERPYGEGRQETLANRLTASYARVDALFRSADIDLSSVDVQVHDATEDTP